MKKTFDENDFVFQYEYKPKQITNQTLNDANQEVNHSDFNSSELNDLTEGKSVNVGNSVFAAA